MKAVNEAYLMFAQRGLDFCQQLAWFMEHGVVVCAGDRFIMAKPIDSSKGDDEWDSESPDCWYVHCAVGRDCLKWFVGQAPFHLPKVAWRRSKDRDNKLKVYSLERLNRLIA